MCTFNEILRRGKIKAVSSGWGTKNTRDGYMLVGKHEREMHKGSLGRRGKIILQKLISKKALCEDAERI